MNEKNVDADVIIVGAGPAGLSSAVWCVELGLDTIIFEKEAETGGQLLSIFNPITNYIGLETANGLEMRDHFFRSFEKTKLAARLSAEIAEIAPIDRSVVTTHGKRFRARALVIATGVRRRRLNVPGEEIFKGKGIIESGSNEKEKTKDKTVLIVGGGDAAMENAIILADFASIVYVVHRRSELSARSEFIEKARLNPKIEFRLETVVNSIKGLNKVEAVELTNTKTGKAEDLAVDIVLVRIGVQPNTDLLQDKIALDTKGYVVTDRNCETNVAGVYAVGDAANPVAPTISTAAGMGAAAAKAIFSSLEDAKAV